MQTSFVRCALLILVSLLVSSATAKAQSWGYGVYGTWGTSCAGSTCNTPSSWSWHYTRDNNVGTVWSSAGSTNPSTSEAIAFWWSATTHQTTNYVTLIPRTVNGVAVHVPSRLNVSRHSCTNPNDPYDCSWQNITTVDLPREMNPAGYTIFFDSVSTNGLLLETTNMRDDGAGNYYFQLAEVYAGDGQNLTNSPKTKTIYPGSGISCDVYGYSKKKVMQNGSSQLSYAFNVTQLSPTSGSTQYAAVFHSEPYKSTSSQQVGDAVSVIYSNSLDSFTRGSDDYVVTRTYHNTSSLSKFMYSYENGGGGTNMQQASGGGNPLLLRADASQGTQGWQLFYLSVKNMDPNTDAEHSAGLDGPWRHFLHMSNPVDVTQMTSGDWWTLARTGGSDYWAYTATRPKYLAVDYNGNLFNPWPVRDTVFGKIVASEHAPTPDSEGNAATNGLIGNMSFNADLSQVFFFHNDYVSSAPVTRRSAMYKPTSTTFQANWWGLPQTIFYNEWLTLAYSNQFNKWAVFGACFNGPYSVDVCMDFTPGGTDVINNEFCPDSSHCNVNVHASNRQMGLDAFFDSLVVTTERKDGGIMEQYGISKNPEGQLFLDGDGFFRLYITERIPGSGTGLLGTSMYSVKVKCTSGG